MFLTLVLFLKLKKPKSYLKNYNMLRSFFFKVFETKTGKFAET